MGDRIDPANRGQLIAWLEQNIIDAAGVAAVIGLAHRNNVYTYRRQYTNFPAPILTHGRCHMWYRPDIEAWKAGPRERKR